MDDCNIDYLFAAFAIVWATIFAYILYLSVRQKQLQREVESLEEKMNKES